MIGVVLWKIISAPFRLLLFAYQSYIQTLSGWMATLLSIVITFALIQGLGMLLGTHPFLVAYEIIFVDVIGFDPLDIVL